MKFKNSKRLVLKIGSSLLVDDNNQLRHEWLASLTQDIAELKKNTEILIVSSGSVALGKPSLKEHSNQPNLKQAAAACGQPLLMQAWQNAFNQYQLTSAQILLTLNDTESRSAYLNARNTIRTLLNHEIVPIINENDSVTTHGILYGDNDRLAARIATMNDADTLILLSDVDGLYDANPSQNPNATFINKVEEITPEVEKMAGGANSLGSGGMKTKIEAAKMATRASCTTYIGDGHKMNPLSNWEKGTEFTASSAPLTARGRWISGSIEPSGKVMIDDGAKAALAKGGSLLHVGIQSIDGDFNEGDTLEIIDSNGKVLGKGLSNLDAAIAKKLAGKRSSDISNILGYDAAAELIHRDHMVIN